MPSLPSALGSLTPNDADMAVSPWGFTGPRQRHHKFFQYRHDVARHRFGIVCIQFADDAGAGTSVQLRSRSGCCGQRLAVATSKGRPTRDLALSWTPDGESIVEHIAGVEDYQVALATFRAACERWPGRLLATK